MLIAKHARESAKNICKLNQILHDQMHQFLLFQRS